jgi:phage FluMu protein Com
MSEMEPYLRGLKPEAQRRVLRFLGLKSPEEGNLDVFPHSDDSQAGRCSVEKGGDADMIEMNTKYFKRRAGIMGFLALMQKRGRELTDFKIRCPRCGAIMDWRKVGVYGFECGDPECWHEFGLELRCPKCNDIIPVIDNPP